MSEQKESSVLFSLKELMSLEEDRIRAEEADRAAAAAAAERARAEAEAQARAAEEARLRAEEERRRQEEQRAREEAARLEAIRLAEIEKARLEAEQKARLEAMAAQQQHERSLAAIKTDQSKKKLRNLLIGLTVGVVIIGGTAGFFVYQDMMKKEQARLELDRKLREEAERAAKAEAEAKALQEKIAGLMKDLAEATDENKKLAIQRQIEEEQRKLESTRRGSGPIGGFRPAGGSGASPTPAPAKPCNCTPGDPLCNCL